VSRSFEQFKIASVQTLFRVRWSSSTINPKTHNTYKVQPSGHQSSWSGQSSIIYENCVHQFNRPNISLQGPDTQSLIMVITCSRSATVQTLGRPPSGRKHQASGRPCRIFQYCISNTETVARPTRVPETSILTCFRSSKAYK
jgi:hypothetical protein